jgi:predicted permease
MNSLLQDLRYTFRQLRRNPGFTAVAVLTLALGIGINTMVFSIVNGFLLRPLPAADPGRLVALWSQNKKEGSTDAVSYPDFLDYRDQTRVLSGLAGQAGTPLSVGGGDRPEMVWGEMVTGNYFSVLGLSPVVGSLISSEDDRPAGARAVAVLSYDGWQRRFHADPAIVGRTVLINGHSFQIIGVAPRGFKGTRLFGYWPEIWVPMGMHAVAWPGTEGLLEARNSRWMIVFGRLKPGINLAGAQQAMSALAARIEHDNPATNRDVGVHLASAKTPFDDPSAVPPEILRLSAILSLAGVGLVLLIACANLANLLLARAAGRRQEIAIRLSIGAAPGRLVRQFLTESFVIAALGGIASFAVLAWTEPLQEAMVPRLPFRVGFDVSLDHRVLGFAVLITVVTGLLFGLLPALQAGRVGLVGALKREQESLVIGRRRFELRSVLLASQVALTVVLLVCGGLFLRSFANARRTETGLRPEGRLVFSINAGLQGYEGDRAQQLFERLRLAVDALPGVVSTTYAFPLPLDTNGRGIRLALGPETAGDPSQPQGFAMSVVGRDYFSTVGTPLLRGRDFSPDDRSDTPGVIIINETMAQRFWPGQDPIGRVVHRGDSDGPALTIIGIAADGKYGQIGETPQSYVYQPLSQRVSSWLTVVVRSKGDPASLVPQVRSTVEGLDPQLALFGVMTMHEHLDNALNLATTTADFAGAFGMLALVLALVGIYGVVAYAVSQRTREIGIRLALGARASAVVRSMMGRSIRAATVGIALGFAAALALGRVLQGILLGVGGSDLLTYASVALLIISAVGLAGYLPARRAARVDPMVALRME